MCYLNFNNLLRLTLNKLRPYIFRSLPLLSGPKTSLKPGERIHANRRAAHAPSTSAGRGARVIRIRGGCCVKLRRPLRPAAGGGLGRRSGWYAGESSGTSGGKASFLPGRREGRGACMCLLPLSEMSPMSFLKDIWGRG